MYRQVLNENEYSLMDNYQKQLEENDFHLKKSIFTHSKKINVLLSVGTSNNPGKILNFGLKRSSMKISSQTIIHTLN